MVREFKVCRENELSMCAEFIRENMRLNQLVLLYGELGSGKTALVKAFSSHYGIDNVMSPTFNILHIYFGENIRIAHADLYRIDSVKHVRELNLEEQIDESLITFIEWPEKADGIFDAYSPMKIEISFEEKCRRIKAVW
ncbi:MAG: tRNA (adenosine(37)-N6)-threonylcarbamoyltransferase complex ATPase subunit type 1 TsaE [bacterium]